MRSLARGRPALRASPDDIPFAGKWRGTVTGRNAGFSQRVVVSGEASGNGAYEGVVGTSFVFEDGQVELQWNNEAGSGWQESAIISSIGLRDDRKDPIVGGATVGVNTKPFWYGTLGATVFDRTTGAPTATGGCGRRSGEPARTWVATTTSG